jgi:hypothetical protein
VAAPNLSLQLIQEEGPQGAAQFGGGRKCSAAPRHAVGAPTRRPIRDCASDVVHVPTNVTHTNLSVHLYLIGTLQSESDGLVCRGPVEAFHRHLCVVTAAAQDRKGTLYAATDHGEDAAHGDGCVWGRKEGCC